MKTLDYQKLEQVSAQKFKFRIGDYLSDAYQIFTQQWMNFVLYTLALVFILGLSSITLIGPYLLTYPLIMGYFVVAEKIENKEEVRFNDFFGGMKNYGQYFIFMLVLLLCSFILFIPLFIWAITAGLFTETMNNEATAEALSTLFAGSFFLLFPYLLIGSVLLQVLFFLVPYLIHYGNYKAIEALKISIKVAKTNVLYLALFVIVCSIISSLGAIICYVGLLATIPFGYLMIYSFLKDFILTKNSAIDGIGTNQEL